LQDKESEGAVSRMSISSCEERAHSDADGVNTADIGIRR
jgi:hypothetical protein